MPFVAIMSPWERGRVNLNYIKSENEINGWISCIVLYCNPIDTKVIGDTLEELEEQSELKIVGCDLL